MLMTIVTYVVPFIIVLSLVVFFHEFGHFIIGRMCGVQVDAFSIGFGKELCGFYDRYGTRWRLAAIPLGGYVKFHGDANGASVPDPDNVRAMPEGERRVTFYAQPVWKRAAIVFAGPAANFVLAVAIFTIIFAINGRDILVPRISSVFEGSAAQQAGLKAGDLVTAVDGAHITNFDKLQELIVTSGGSPMAITVKRDGQELTFTATPQVKETEGVLGKIKIYMLGVRSSNDPADASVEHYGVLQSARLAVEETGSVVTRTFGYIGGLISGREEADQLTGPIGIMQVSGKMAQASVKVGIWPMFNLVAILSISIGLLNLMPVPLLDGGHLAFFAIEAIRGKALNERVQEFAFRIGFAMVCTLMLFSTYNDVARLVRKLTGAG
jgi:regulator of sigma E protease